MTRHVLLTDTELQTVHEGVTEACLSDTDEAQLATPEGALRLVAATNAAADHGRRLLDDAVAGARHADHSWTDIGSVLGVSEQVAQQRFGTATEPPAPTSAGTQRRVTHRATAFNELAVLKREQPDGWHLVGFGIAKLILEGSDHPWEHQRLTFPSHTLLRTMERGGWQIVGVWGPWTYMKRPVQE